MKVAIQEKINNDAVVGALSCLLLLLAAVCPLNIVSGVILIAWAVALFVHYKKITKTFVQVRGLLALSWFGSMGLAALKLHSLQQEWAILTWISIGLLYPAFLGGYCIAMKGVKLDTPAHLQKPNARSIYITLLILFMGIFVVFIAEAIQAGSVPLFSNDMAAYKKFGIKYLHYITVVAGLAPALALAYGCQWGFRTKEMIVLGALAALLGLIPIFIVSRQLLLMEVVVACIAWVIASKREYQITIKIVIIFILVCFLLYFVLSAFRNQNTEYIKAVFELPQAAGPIEVGFWQLYLYLCFGFDSFNSLVINLTQHTFGASTGAPIIAFTLTKNLFTGSLPDLTEFYILPTYTTFTMIAEPYTDFGAVGVLAYGILLGIGSGLIELWARCRPSIWNVTAYGLVLYTLLISFFVCEVALPVFWFYLFTLFVCYYFAIYANRKYK